MQLILQVEGESKPHQPKPQSNLMGKIIMANSNVTPIQSIPPMAKLKSGLEQLEKNDQFELMMAGDAVMNLGNILCTHASSPMEDLTEVNVAGIALAIQVLGSHIAMRCEDLECKADRMLKQLSGIEEQQSSLGG